MSCENLQTAIDTLATQATNCTTPAQLGALSVATFQEVHNTICPNLPETFCIQELGTYDPASMPAPVSSDLVCFGRDPSKRYWLNVDPTGADASRKWIPIGTYIRDLGATITSPADDPDYDWEVGQTTAGTYYGNMNNSGWRRIDHSPQIGGYTADWDGGNWDYDKQYLIGLTMASSQSITMTGFDDGHYVFRVKFNLSWEWDSAVTDAVYCDLLKNGSTEISQYHRIESFYAGSDEQAFIEVWVVGEMDLVEADTIAPKIHDGAGNDVPDAQDFDYAKNADRLGLIEFERTGD